MDIEINSKLMSFLITYALLCYITKPIIRNLFWIAKKAIKHFSKKDKEREQEKRNG